MPKFYVYLKGPGETSIIPVEADGAPNLATAEPWITIGSSSFRLTEIVAVVSDDDLQQRRTPARRQA